MNKITQRDKRRKRIRKNVFGTQARPRLSVFRSNKYLYAQIVNDEKGITLLSVSSQGEKTNSKGKTATIMASELGKNLGVMAAKKKIKKVVFDRSGYKYHGRVKAFAEAARKSGLEF